MAKPIPTAEVTPPLPLAALILPLSNAVLAIVVIIVAKSLALCS